MIKAERKLLIDKIVKIIFFFLGMLCASSILLIIFFILFKGVTPFIKVYPSSSKVNIVNFLFSTNYSDGIYGILGLTINTVVIVLIVGLISLPLSVLSSLFIVRIANKYISKILESIVELLSSIPSIIYGLFGMGVINKIVSYIAELVGVQTSGGVSTFSVIIVLSMMIIPTMTTLTITSMKNVNNNLILGSYALGATKSQTDFNIVIKGSKSGIFSALILSIGRALGEATAVSMVCGGANGISVGLFSPTSTLTYVMMQSFHEASGLNYDIRFSVGIILVLIILITNIILNKIKKVVCRYE